LAERWGGYIMPRRIRSSKHKKYSLQQIAIQKIPRVFITNTRINQVLRLTIDEFSYEEKIIIYLYYLVELDINEIVSLTEIPRLYVISTLVLYYERLSFKLNVFKKSVSYDMTDLVPIQEMFEIKENVV